MGTGLERDTLALNAAGIGAINSALGSGDFKVGASLASFGVGSANQQSDYVFGGAGGPGAVELDIFDALGNMRELIIMDVPEPATSTYSVVFGLGLVGFAVSCNSIPQNMTRVAAGILDKILLVVILGRIKFRGLGDLCYHRSLEFAGLIHLRFNALCGLPLFVTRIENGGSILGPYVVVLLIFRGGIMHAEKISQQLFITQFDWIENYLDSLRVPRTSGANLLISRIRNRAAAVTDLCFDYARKFTDDFLHSPETASSENSRFMLDCPRGLVRSR